MKVEQKRLESVSVKQSTRKRRGAKATPKQMVLAKWPLAVLWSYNGGYTYVLEQPGHHSTHLGGGYTPTKAWADAARRINDVSK